MADFTITWVGDKPPHTYKGNATYSVAVRDDASGAENRKVKLEQSEGDAAPTVGQKLAGVELQPHPRFDDAKLISLAGGAAPQRAAAPAASAGRTDAVGASIERQTSAKAATAYVALAVAAGKITTEEAFDLIGKTTEVVYDAIQGKAKQAEAQKPEAAADEGDDIPF